MAQALPPIEAWYQWLSERIDAHRNASVSPAAISDRIILRDGDQVTINGRSGEFGNWFFSRDERPASLRLSYDGGSSVTLHRGARQQSIALGQQLRVNDDLILSWRYAQPYTDRAEVTAYDRDTLGKTLWGLLQLWFDYNPAYRLRALFDPLESAQPSFVPTQDGHTQPGLHIGFVVITTADSRTQLPVYVERTNFTTDDPVRIYFRDLSNQSSTFSRGRVLSHLRLRDIVGKPFIIDLNYAHNPYCAVIEETPCPDIREEPIPVSVEAGERRPAGRVMAPPPELLDLAKSIQHEVRGQ